MKRILSILILVVVAAHGSPVPNDAVVVFFSNCSGKNYLSSVTQAQLDSSPSWHHKRDEAPPLSPMKAKAASERVITTIVSPEELKTDWNFPSITLALSSDGDPDHPKWYYIIRWHGPRVGFIRQSDGKHVTGRAGGTAGERLKEIHDDFTLIVLMDGHCSQPKDVTPNKSLQATSQ